MPRRSLKQLWIQEFSTYTTTKFRQDLFAGLTVAAVALPLALAFGVASGASAAAGLVTAIISGFVIGILSGAPYQISGPTGAMSAVLIVLSARYGLTGVWISGMLSGALLLVIGLLKLGRFIAFIPAPVITGFTSGIAIIIAVGQLDNLFGFKTPNADSAALKLFEIIRTHPIPNYTSIMVGGLVMAIMIAWPKSWNLKFPGSLLAIIIATSTYVGLGLNIATIGEIPQTLFLPERLDIRSLPWENLSEFIVPTLTITALGAVESLLCGAVASSMTGIRLQANQELVAQGVGNLILPFAGGVPATAAIARTSVGIRAGGQTRLVSIIHSFVLLASMFLFAGIMSKIPLAALAGVLIVTAYRMNEWESIHFYFSRKFKTAISTFLITMIATVTLDLTQAILIGTFISGAIFLSEVAKIDVEVKEVEVEKLKARGIEVGHNCKHIKVAYLSGPLFFAATGHFREAFVNLPNAHHLILSMRGVPIIDTSGIKAIEDLQDRLSSSGGRLLLAGVSESVLTMLKRSGLLQKLGPDSVYWSSDQAIVAASKLVVHPTHA